MRTGNVLNLVPLVAILCVSCTRSHYTVQLTGNELPASKTAISCAYGFSGAADARTSHSTIGPSGNTFEIANLIGYMDRQIRSWLPAVHISEVSVSDRPELAVRLVHAYSEGQAMSGYFTVALVGTLDATDSKIFRGRSGGTTWVGNKAAFLSRLKKAADDALLQLNRWLSNRCTSAKAEAKTPMTHETKKAPKQGLL